MLLLTIPLQKNTHQRYHGAGHRRLWLHLGGSGDAGYCETIITNLDYIQILLCLFLVISKFYYIFELHHILVKRNSFKQNYAFTYFWRTTQQQEIDYIEERDGFLHCYEFEWSANKKARLSKTFSSAYPNSSLEVINRDNYVVSARKPHFLKNPVLKWGRCKTASSMCRELSTDFPAITLKCL